MLCDISQGGIGYEANILYVPVMISNEAKVGRHCPETFPSRKHRSLDDKTGEVSGFFNVRVDCFCELHKVVLPKRGLWSYIQNSVRSIEAVFDHVLLLQIYCCLTGTRPTRLPAWAS